MQSTPLSATRGDRNAREIRNTVSVVFLRGLFGLMASGVKVSVWAHDSQTVLNPLIGLRWLKDRRNMTAMRDWAQLWAHCSELLSQFIERIEQVKRSQVS